MLNPNQDLSARLAQVSNILIMCVLTQPECTLYNVLKNTTVQIPVINPFRCRSIKSSPLSRGVESYMYIAMSIYDVKIT